MTLEQEKADFNARAKASMLQFLRAKSWPEKIRSIERMNRAGKTARQAMQTARARAASADVASATESSEK